MIGIGERIRELRVKKGLSQNELAKELYVSRQTVSRWEKEAVLPNLDNILHLCEFFEVDSNHLLKSCNKANQVKGLDNNVLVSEDVPRRIDMHGISEKKMMIELGLVVVVFFLLRTSWLPSFLIASLIIMKKDHVKEIILLKLLAYALIIYFILEMVSFQLFL